MFFVVVNVQFFYKYLFKCFVVVDDMLFCIVTFNLWLHFNILSAAYCAVIWHNQCNVIMTNLERHMQHKRLQGLCTKNSQ